MIQRFSFGHPIPTESVEQVLPLCGGSVPFLTPKAGRIGCGKTASSMAWARCPAG